MMCAMLSGFRKSLINHSIVLKGFVGIIDSSMGFAAGASVASVGHVLMRCKVTNNI